ncbi:MAG: insulinase family protein, partial [Bacilli bacterium]|nr:insulinase family protein [Bacilli bacterium]
MKEVKMKTKPTMLEDKNIKTIDISLIYPFLFQDEDTFNYDLMVSILNNHSAAYPNEKDFAVEVSKRLIIHYRAALKTIGDTSFLRFDLTIPQKNITPEYDIEEAIKFFKDTIFNPFAKEESFDERTFEREREYVLARMEDSNNNNIYAQSFNRFIKLIDPQEEVFASIDTDLMNLKNANAKRSYQLYKEIVFNTDPLIYVFGNYEEKEIMDLLEKYFPSQKSEKNFELKYDNIFHPSPRDYIEEHSKFNQTVLFMLYDCQNITPDEKEYLSLIGNILGGSENDLIFKQLRLNNNLVYSTNVAKYIY